MTQPTLNAWLTTARQALATGSDAPALDARRLAEHVLNLSTTRLIVDGPRMLDASEVAALDAALKRRCDGEPLALIVGHAGFGELELTVDRHVLIPRPETELLVELTLAALDEPAPTSRRVVDLGTGSGAIALSLAHARPSWSIVATDQSARAIARARHNASTLGLDRVAFRQGDWFAALEGEAPFDALVSNPPYIAPGDPHLAALAHEPQAALVAADDGLADLRQLCAGAPVRLRPGGWLLVEHGFDQGSAVRRLMAQADLQDIDTQRDLAGHERVTRGRRSRS
ncbi:peptide chain release factor N(5)-glutamine methyltransferase [Salinisphaera hydrothermalis]|uniref:peptide chain release factor N(5)-glutamine methyltransferase n=1 Tax=Salinisphaera hydrothermalis TaxID=563188 RepID=UPI00334109E1